MSTLRVLVVDDSSVARKLLVGIIDADPGLRVVAQASSGEEACKLAMRLKPDVITMDIHMPVMDGFETTRKIMEEIPLPIVIVSADYDPSDVARSFRALEAGALTVMPKPRMSANGEYSEQAQELRQAVKLMAGVKVFKRHKPRPRRVPARRPRPKRAADFEVVAIGSSTGGPAALKGILSMLPDTIPVPILIAQHIGQGFDQGLADWLDTLTPLRVRLASNGQRLAPGDVLIAPHGLHMGVSKNHRIVLKDTPPIGGHRPSATYLFRSLADTYAAGALCVILSGMGEDGVAGLQSVKAGGGRVLAQDESSSVVYGMPGAAVRAGVVDESLPIHDLPFRIVEAFRPR